jgi:hypothetical protein
LRIVDLERAHAVTAFLGQHPQVGGQVKICAGRRAAIGYWFVGMARRRM